MRKSVVFSYLLSAAIIGGSVWASINQQAIKDWWYLRSYVPTTEVKAYADDAQFTDYGRDLFYLHDPKIIDGAEFAAQCTVAESALVLGCYNGIDIYILDVQEPQLEDVELVTAAHEMLHAAYDRLSEEEKTRINQLLETTFQAVADDRLIELIADYEARDPTSRHDELHSILPTEVATLPPELEAYYSQYFTTRQPTITAFNSYESVFTDLNNQIADFDAQLASGKQAIADLEASLASQRNSITANRATLEGLLANDQIEQYNSLVPGFNASIESYNTDVARLRSEIDSYNEVVSARNGIVVSQQELVESLSTNTESL